MLIVLYVVLAFAIGLIGRRRKFGLWGYFFAALLLTPVIGLLLVIASDSPRKIKRAAAAQASLTGPVDFVPDGLVVVRPGHMPSRRV